MSEAFELTISSTDPLLIDQLWAHGANGVFEQSDESVVGFDNEATAQAAIASLPADIQWALAPSPPLSSWDSYAAVVTDGRFLLRPPWLEATNADIEQLAAANQPTIELVIDPGAAFGHGGHPTTLLALRALTKELRPTDSVLDVGSGSGVLAIAAARLGASAVTATDIDPAAVAATTANAEANGVEVVASASRMHDLVGPFDVVVANMERPTLAAHLDELWRLTGRVLILSGVLAADPLNLDDIGAATQAVEQLGDWGSIALQRDSGLLPDSGKRS